MSPATGVKGGSEPGAADCSIHGCLAPLRHGWRGSMAGTWRSCKDHRVEDLTIFPASAFVEMALEAGVQLFEGRAFVIEDFEIRKPLILPDPPSGLQLELAYDQAERTFAIQSRLDQGVAWSVHVVGSMRGERTESAFAASTWSEDAAGRLGTSGTRGLLSPHGRSGACATARNSVRFANCRQVRADRRAGWPFPREGRAAPASIRCTPCFSMARCKCFPPGQRPSKGAGRG